MFVHLLNELSVDLDVIEGGSPVAKAHPTQNVRKGLQSSNLISLGDLSHHVLAFENVCLIYNFPLPNSFATKERTCGALVFRQKQ